MHDFVPHLGRKPIESFESNFQIKSDVGMKVTFRRVNIGLASGYYQFPILVKEVLSFLP